MFILGGRVENKEKEGDYGYLMDYYQGCFLVNQFLVKDEVER